MTAMRTATLLLMLAGGLLLLPARATGQVVVYRCTDTSGHVTIQNDVACPAGTRQERQLIDTPPALPAYVAREVRMPDVVAGEQARVEQAVSEAVADAVPVPVPESERTLPPLLYQCRTWNGQDYLTEDGTPARRCAPLQLVGLDGPSVPAAARACEQVAVAPTRYENVDACNRATGSALMATGPKTSTLSPSMRYWRLLIAPKASSSLC